MLKLNFEKAFKDSIEEEKLIETPFKDIDYRTLSKAKKSELDDLKSGKATKEQLLGYEFEWDTWNFFRDLKPLYMDHPTEIFQFDLSEYANSFSQKAKDYVKKAKEETNKDIDVDEIEKMLSPQKYRQTDVIAIFERHIFIIECKASLKKVGLNALKNKLDRWLILKPFIEDRCKEIFGVAYNPVFVACSKNFDIDNQDAAKYLKNNSIIIFDEKRKDYIKEVLETSDSPEFAFTQFLGFFRNGEPDFNEIIEINTSKTKKSNKIKNFTKKPWEISAFSSFSGGGKKNEVFTFSLKPEEMLKISTVAHQQFNNIFEAEQADANYYQRILTSSRLDKIKEHLQKKSTPFANNILVSYRGTDDKIKFIPNNNNKKTIVKGNIAGTLTLDACPGTFHVIDGQHRLFGYTTIEKAPKSLRNSHRVIVTAFKGLTVAEEAEIFLEVNSNAKPIVPSLLMEIEWASRSESLSNLCNGFIFQMRGNSSSPLCEKINDAQKAEKDKLAPKNLKTSITKFECFGGKDLDHWLKNKKSLNTLPDEDFIIFWSSDFQETVTNYYNHFAEMVSIFKLVNFDRWHHGTGVIRNIFFGGLLQTMDRITISAIAEWRLNNPDVNLNTYLAKPKDDQEKEIIKKFKDKALREIAKYSLNKIKVLADGFKKLSEVEKDRILHKDMFKLGAGADKLPCTYLVKKLLNSYKDLGRPKDDENWERLEHNLSKKDIIQLKAKLKRQERKIAKYAKNYKKDNMDEDIRVRGGNHFDELKNVSHSLLSRTLSNMFWLGLIKKHLFQYSQETKKGNCWWGIEQRHSEHEIEYGEEAYAEPWDFVEIEHVDLLKSSNKIIRAVNYSWEKRVRTIQYLWQLMLIPEEGDVYEEYDWDEIVNDEIDIDDKSVWSNKEKDIAKIVQSNNWKTGSKYISLFAKLRNLGRHKKSNQTPHKEPWKIHQPKFEYYEPLFINKLEDAKDLFDMLQNIEDKQKEDEADED